MNPSKDHDNWLIVGETIRLIEEPVALYTSHIIEEWHAKLPCLSLPQCTNPAVCLTKKDPRDLCLSCKGWYDELAKFHQKTKIGKIREIKWRENCDTSNWQNDPWEVAKFFMPALGDNKVTVKNAESTDLSSLLNVLSWTEDAVFAPGRRVDLNLVKKLRSDRNAWAHAPDQKLAEATLNDAFDIANKFVADLYTVFNRSEVKECIESIKDLETNGMSQLKSRIPDRPQTFVGRDSEVKKIISSLVENDRGIVSIVGGPGFGKSTVAVAVSHHLSEELKIIVIFSFLSHASTVPAVITRLCHDVGVPPGEDPESSLMLWLKSIDRKVILVMDNIEQLLENDVKSKFVELVRTLRKNSQQRVQIVTTSRTEFTNCGETPVNHHIGDLDETASVELLKKCCATEVENTYLSELANLCGFAPLALCIAGTLIPELDDPLELIQLLREKPMEALERVQKAIEFSFQKLNEEDQRGLICLSVFDGDFDRQSAEGVIKKNMLKTLRFLSNLVTRSLVQKTIDRRYVIHSLIRQFLAEHDGFEHDKAMAQALMVTHFLKMCNSWTLKCYSKNEFRTARKLLKKDVHNVEKTLKICTQIQATNMSETVRESLANCEIYKSSYRFFHNFSWDLLTETVLTNFSKSCMKLAESRDQPAIAITFQYEIAAQIGHKFGHKNAREYADQVETIMALFKKNEAVLKKDRYLYESCYNLIARYYLSKKPYKLPAELTKYECPSDDPKKGEQNDYEKIAEVYILMKSGNLNKILGHKAFNKDKEKSKKYTKLAEKSYNKAITLAKERFGDDHQIICILHKLLGDLYFDQHKNNEALNFYFRAKNLYKGLELDSNEHFVRLLKNCGVCLLSLRRYNESVEVLKEARDIVDKLTEKHTPCKAMVYCKLAISCSFLEPDCKEAAEYAKEALRMQTLLDSKRDVDELQKIVEKAGEFVVVQNIIKSFQVKRDGRKSNLKNCIPDKPQVFIGREDEVKQIISSLVENDCGIVSIVGGPGFGKSTIACEVSHHLSNKHGIVVIFTCLSHASTVSQVRKCLCRVVGINPGESPESSLTFWLKSIEKKVVLVMDNIEKLLETNLKSKFIELVCNLRKNSHQHLHILTTTRTTFSVSGQTTENHQIGKLDEKSSIEILKRRCRNKVDNAHELAKLCGFVPLALCIAGAIIPDLDDPSELVRWLRKKSLEAEKKNSDQCVEQIIEFSFQKLTLEDQKGIVCLSVFNGNFEINSAREVIDKNESQTVELLKKLVSRSLIQFNSDKRYVMHSLIRRFLVDHHKEEKSKAQGLMVNHFLVACHSLTMKCYSPNGFITARESLKKDIHNIEETLRICTQDQATSLNADILHFLTSSNVYKSPFFFFYNFSLDLLSESVLWKFFESCFRLAESRKQPAIEITFQCLLAYQEGLKSAWKSSEYKDRLRTISAAFCKNKAVLKEDRFFFMFCYYFSARYNCRKATNPLAPDLSEDDLPALPENKTDLNPEEKATKVHFLIERANIYKKRANKAFKEDKGKYNEHLKSEKDHYEQALALAKTFFGDHELTCIVCKLLGDLYFNLREHTEALTYYDDAVRLRTKLGLDANESFVFLLKNCGVCLSNLACFDVSVETLKKARDMADKLTEKETLCRARVNYVLARTYLEWKPDCQEAAGYAKEAMKMWKSLDPNMVETLENIIRRQEEMTLDSLDN